ncbi:Predicted branched-chain amino acid permease (azaleucine resistance) [Blastococcus tunisiensis]|uniref:Predicted branched-chain amino acid permease (Azaleucine resistance) n=1 Tax=Blastococcus tunisiensis TaxID=1798228 RepID=A0A1I1ZQ31_9ACTN|nr:Predicted branched-chain amino acid permease (azaleucine resistance) [Blastococcus sp. DSM 46838]
MREGVPYTAANFALALSFGVVASAAGMPPAAVIAMSVLMHAGAAQFAAVGILVAGGGLGAAVSAAALVNSRFVPMGFAVGSSLRGGRVRRAFEGQAVVTSAWVLAAEPGGSFQRERLIGHAAIHYAGWVSGTVAGVLAPPLDANALGLDAVFPAFFLGLLFAEIRDRRRATVALLGGAIALALVPATPPGVPALVASAATLIGLRPRRST